MAEPKKTNPELRKVLCSTSVLIDPIKHVSRVLIQRSVKRTIASHDMAGTNAGAVAIYDDPREAIPLDDFKGQLEKLFKEKAPKITIDAKNMKINGFFSVQIKQESDVPGSLNLQRYIVELANNHIRGESPRGEREAGALLGFPSGWGK